ncbi:substrate-binding domain-containing protein [Thiorhodococcus fuscus]|uniref:Substrate-binding domain-containing protein n=1 Tax=Thiorhodococcus fuscus TaxID=527200 RepID=A0ABW4YA20_9GAMM
MSIQNLRQIALSCLLVCACWSPPAECDPNALPIGGTGDALGILEQLLEAYRADRPETSLKLLEGSLGTGGGIRALTDDRLSIAIAGRDLNERERGLGLTTHPFARTPLILVAQPKVGREDLTTEALIALYLGRRTTWSDGSRCRPVMRPANDSDTLMLASLDPELASAIQFALGRTDLLVTLTSQENLDSIAYIQGAFGYAPLAQVVSEKRDLRILTFNGQAPNPEALADSPYPLWIEFSLVTPADPEPEVQQFLAFVFSAKGRTIIEANGSLPISTPRFPD